MSSVGFTSQPKNDELEKLRSLNDIARNLRNAEAALIKRDDNLIAAHLQVAKWNVEQVKKAIAVVDNLEFVSRGNDYAYPTSAAFTVRSAARPRWKAVLLDTSGRLGNCLPRRSHDGIKLPPSILEIPFDPLIESLVTRRYNNLQS